jgi:M6 family metalloprotease-like protein
MRFGIGAGALAVFTAGMIGLAALERPAAPASSGRGFSATPLRRGVIEALRARGKQVSLPFPNSINQGRKFNPGGGTVGQLETAPTQKVLVIFVAFTNAPPGGPDVRLDLATYFDPMLFGDTYDPSDYAGIPGHPTDRTLKNYYSQVSYGAVDVVTLNLPSTMGWTQVSHPHEYYCRPDGTHDYGWGPYPENVQGMIVEALHAVDAQVDFSQYAVNGEVPNLFVVHAGGGAEWNSDPAQFWSHSWSLDAYTGLTTADLTFDGVKVNNYALMPEVGGDLTGYTGFQFGPFPPTVGVYAHEYGHVLGLPDQYDYGYESLGTSIYSLMAGGSWNQWPSDDWMFAGNSPSFLDAWSRYRLGFVTPTLVTQDASPALATLPPAEVSPVVYKMEVPFSGGKEYFLFENRQQIGFDEGLNVYVRNPIGTQVHGLAIYHVDDVVMNRNYGRPNEAENWKEFRSEGWRKVWTGESHYGISLIQADDRWDLERGVFGGFTGDLYPGSRTATTFGSTTFPNSSSYYFWAGSAPKFGYSGVTADNIVEQAGTVSATLSFVKVK